MGRIRQADWSAQCPWGGLQDKPAYLTDDGIPYTSIIGWPATPIPSGLARVAYTGLYSDLSNRPSFGSAAFSNVPDFATAAQGALADSALQPGDNVSELFNDVPYAIVPDAEHYQSGRIDFISAQQSYAVVFSPVMAGVPEIDTQIYMSDGTGEMFYEAIQGDVTDENGFTLWLNVAPTVSAGWCIWRAKVP